MIKVNIKPISVNKCWQGRRFKTQDYKFYEQELQDLLPPFYEIPVGELKAYYEFGVSSVLSDWDNPIKPFQDVLQKKYGFDDKFIMQATVKKVHVKKGKEYVKFKIESND